MKYKIGQICYMTGGFSGFLEATGLKLPLKCKVETYNTEENSYDVRVLSATYNIKSAELPDGKFMRVEERHTLAGVCPKNLMGSV